METGEDHQDNEKGKHDTAKQATPINADTLIMTIKTDQERSDWYQADQLNVMTTIHAM